MIARLDEGYDVVIASRYQHGSQWYGIPPHRQLFSLGVRLLLGFMLPLRGVRDYSCGYRAYRAEVLQRAADYWGDAFITEQGFACMVEILSRLKRLEPPVRFAEIPMVLHYDLKPGPTKMPIRQTILDTLKLGLRYRLGLDKNGKR
jgi:dolichol-phosphate mannosyltransferase